MLRWIIIAVLVTGTLGIFWRAPWKDDTDRLFADARVRVEQALQTVDTFGLRDDCRPVTRPVPARITAAVATIRADAPKDPSTRAAARVQADAVAACFTQVPRVHATWRRAERQLRAAARA